jgi:hypothetical protein
VTPEERGRREIICAYRSSLEASLAKSELEAFGIEAWVLEPRRGEYESPVGEVKLAVRSVDAATARELLAGDHSADLAQIPEAGLPPAPGDLCPHCGADALEQVSGATTADVLRRMLWSILALLFGSHAPVERRSGAWRCRACGR